MQVFLVAFNNRFKRLHGLHARIFSRTLFLPSLLLILASEHQTELFSVLLSCDVQRGKIEIVFAFVFSGFVTTNSSIAYMYECVLCNCGRAFMDFSDDS